MEPILEDIFSDILKQCDTPISIKEVFEKLPQYTKKEIKNSFNSLIAKGLLHKDKSSKYANLSFFGVIEAVFLATDKGYGFAQPKTPLKSGRDVFIPEKFKSDAWHGDEVLVKLVQARYKRDSKGDRQEGQIIKTIARSKSHILGTLLFSDNFYYVSTDIKKFPPISIDESCLNGAKEGDKVAVKVRYYGNFEYMPQGEIQKVLGISSTREASVNSVLYSHGINREFPPMAIVQSEGIGQEITPDMFGDRLDLTDKLIVTIDGDYSKDFDDAISFEKLPNGNSLLGVHIADVSHYVTEDSPLDLEAFERATSVYFANEVIPMLPFSLSNGICSLNPDVNRFSMSVFMELNKNGDVVNKSFHNSVIKSKYRLTYTKVNKILDGDLELCSDYAQIVDNLVEMNSMSLKLEQKRNGKGSLDLDIPECYVICDENGAPVDVKMRSRGASEKLIEQFMVLTNETVAEYMHKNEVPSVYRVHEPPNEEKLKIFADISRLFGFKISNDDLSDPLALQKVLNESKDTPQHKVVATMLLRSLSRARYSEKCIGHNGLASEFYLHFTSPIRRYPDLVVHRMLKKAIEETGTTINDKNFVESAAKQSTDREKHADDASRDVEKLYMAEYMSQFIGDEFDASVSGVQNFGIFVELPNTIEGLVRIDSIPDDQYVYDEELVRLTGKNSGKVYTIGTSMRVKLINASAINGQIDFVII